MAHLLESSAPAHGIGLCQIGSIEFDRIRHLFDLEPSHVLIHSLLGGPIAPESNGRAATPAAAEQGDTARVANALERIKQLTPEQVKALLAANRAK
jgi:hypothetical protein